MEYEDFKRLFTESLKVGENLEKPGGGTTTIMSYSHDSVAYKRGKSIMRPSLETLFAMYKKHSNRTVSTSDLKNDMPEVFDSSARPAGHSCNCTFFFQALQRMGLTDQISGKGVRGSPYSIVIVG